MKLVKTGPREYATPDGRFTAKWQSKQGARSCYHVHDRDGFKYLRAFNLVEVREAIAELMR